MTVGGVDTFVLGWQIKGDDYKEACSLDCQPGGRDMKWRREEEAQWLNRLAMLSMVDWMYDGEG